MFVTTADATIGANAGTLAFDLDTGAQPPLYADAPGAFDPGRILFDYGADACMFVTIEDAEPGLPFPPSRNEFLFFNDPRDGGMRSVGRHGDVVATVAAALSEASGAPPLAADATRVPADTGSQATCMGKLASVGVTKKAPPNGEFGLSSALLDGGNDRHAAEHGGPLSIVTAGGAIPIKVPKTVHAPTFGFDILSVGDMGTFGITTVLGPNARLEKGNAVITLPRHRGLFYIGAFTAAYPGGAGTVPTATRRRL